MDEFAGGESAHSTDIEITHEEMMSTLGKNKVLREFEELEPFAERIRLEGDEYTKSFAKWI